MLDISVKYKKYLTAIVLITIIVPFIDLVLMGALSGQGSHIVEILHTVLSLISIIALLTTIVFLLLYFIDYIWLINFHKGPLNISEENRQSLKGNEPRIIKWLASFFIFTFSTSLILCLLYLSVEKTAQSIFHVTFEPVNIAIGYILGFWAISFICVFILLVGYVIVSFVLWIIGKLKKSATESS